MGLPTNPDKTEYGSWTDIKPAVGNIIINVNKRLCVS